MKTVIHKSEHYCRAADIFEVYQDTPMAAFLDSAGETGRFSIIGLNPYLTLIETDGVVTRNGEVLCQPLEEALADILRACREENPTHLPLTAGAIGYFSYDYGRKFENIQTRHPKTLDVPDAVFAFYDNLMIEDRQEKALYLTARGELAPAQESIAALQRMIEGIKPAPVPPRRRTLASFAPNFRKEDYKETIDRMIRYIVDGDIYIANMTQKLTVDSTRKPYEMYRYLRTYNPAPYSAFFQYGDFQVICASMERFLLVKDGAVETRPIKGTRKRGDTPQEDEAMRRELEASGKDRSELLMIVDLERNDLNHVCKPGTVRVTDHFRVEAYATVFHLVTTIVGSLREELGAADLIAAAFPGGSITGAPKIRAMEIIDELEHDRRGLYTGSLGYFSLNGDCDLNIIIRTAVHKNGAYHIGVGGGITCESDLEFEYEETLQKAKALLEALGEEEGG